MREILFRVRDNKHWYFGLPLRISETNVQFEGVDENGGHVYSLLNEKNTLGQFTGKTDKNGKKIFDGDIVKDHFGNVGVVWYSEHFLRWQVSFYKGRADLCKYPEIGTYIFDWTYPNVDFEIIGNIYDNSELLEE